jgi:hypothetical protein
VVVEEEKLLELQRRRIVLSCPVNYDVRGERG